MIDPRASAHIYLDHNATTPLLPDVVDAMLPFLREHFGNPSSSHSYGQTAKRALDAARAQVACLIGCETDEIVFTSGGTEANNLAIRGTVEAHDGATVIVTSVVEHPATSRPCDWLESHGTRVHRIGVDALGRVDVVRARAAIQNGATLVTMMHSNNETGVIQPVAELTHVAHDVGAVVHTDAAQSVGKVPIAVRDLGVDLLSIAGHKLYAPKGVGALFVRRGVKLSPFVLGAGHERGLRPGTENVASIVGLGVACDLARRDLAEVSVRVRGLRDKLWAQLRDAVAGLALNGHPDERLPNTLNVRFPGVVGSALLAAVPEVAASTGSACHDGRETASSVLLAMGIAPDAAAGSVRLTLGRATTEAEVERAVALLARAWRSLRGT